MCYLSKRRTRSSRATNVTSKVESAMTHTTLVKIDTRDLEPPRAEDASVDPKNLKTRTAVVSIELKLGSNKRGTYCSKLSDELGRKRPFSGKRTRNFESNKLICTPNKRSLGFHRAQVRHARTDLHLADVQISKHLNLMTAHRARIQYATRASSFPRPFRSDFNGCIPSIRYRFDARAREIPSRNLYPDDVLPETLFSWAKPSGRSVPLNALNSTARRLRREPRPMRGRDGRAR